MAKEKPAVKTVTMDDGRTVDFTGDKRLIKTSIENADGTLAVRLDWVNGETRTHKLNPAILAKYALHGAEQKLGDEISGVKELEDAIEAVDQLMTRLDSGDWTKERDGSGMAGASVLAKALVKVSGQSIETVRKYLAGLDNKTKLALRGTPQIAPVIKEIEAEIAARSAKAAPTIDVSATLTALANMGSAPAVPAAVEALM